MKTFLKVSAVVLALAASVASASAEVIVDSSTSTVNYAGYMQGTSPYNAADPSAFISSGTNASFNPGTGNVWSNPITNTTWVSDNVNSAPGGSYVAQNGYYTYTSTFGATAGNYTGTLELMADDTVAAYLNGTLLVPAGAIGNDGECSQQLPSCTALDTVPLNVALNSSNTLTFVVEQTGGSGEGLDFAADLAPVPEPNTLVMLGTGLLGVAGAARRKIGC